MNKVAVLMSTYNGEKYIQEQLDSLMNQKDVELKIYIRDDESKDNTVKIIESNYDKLNIKLYKGKNVGPAKSFMELIKKCDKDFDYYAFCDQDDYWKEDKIISAINIMKKSGENNIPKVYYSNVDIVDKNLNFMNKGLINEFNTTNTMYMIKNPCIGCTEIFNKALMEKLKFSENNIIMHDWWILKSCVCLNGIICKDDNSYIKYRQHENNVVGGKKVRNIFKDFNRYLKSFELITSEANDLLELYNSSLSEENKANLTEIANFGKMRLYKKLKTLMSNKYSIGIKRYNIRFSLALLFYRCK